MEKTNVIRSLQSFVALPLLATNLIISPMAFDKLPTAAVSATDQNWHLFTEAPDNKQLALNKEAEKIDAYFASLGSPLAGYGKKFVEEAEKNGIPSTLLPAIAMAESTACKFYIKGTHNCWGWGSGKIKFNSFDHAIEMISSHLGGNQPKTARYYANKDLEGIIESFNPSHIAPRYQGIIKLVMKRINNFPVPEAQTILAVNS